MNDRFKFRFFNEYSNKLESCDEYDLKDIFESGNPVMQCTGLKDKNGKLIYESDIIKIGNGSVNGSVIETIREVKWTINTWNVPVWVVDKPNFSHYIEVIGNIYENKELLEEE